MSERRREPHPGPDGAANWFTFFLGPHPRSVTESRAFNHADNVAALISGTLVAQLPAAELFFVSTDMTELARHAASTWTDYRLHPEGLPAWIVIRKGGLVCDITIGDCVELTTALQEHHFRGSAGRPLFYAMLKKAGVLPGCGARAVAGGAVGRPPQCPADPRRHRVPGPWRRARSKRPR